MNKPLTFTAKELNSTIYLAAIGSPVIDGLQYRLNESAEWQQYILGTEIELENVGDYVQFQNTKNQLSTSNDNFVYFAMTGKIAASGNIQSLLNYSNSCTSYCYVNMFETCTSLTKAPELPATNLANDCYRNMFSFCINLIDAPELPATELANLCYSDMFKGCISLTEAPVLPATNLANWCYSDMFESCINLTKAPKLPATNLADGCYLGMFNGCSKLKNKPKINNLIKKVVYIY